MMKNIISLLIALTAVIQVNGQEKFTLSYKMDKGKTYRYESAYTFDASQEMMGNEMKVTGDTRSILRFEAEERKENGNMVIVTSTEESVTHTSMMGRDTTIRRTDIKDRARIEMDPAGNIISETEVDSAAKKASFMPGESSFINLPSHAVSIGEKWSKTTVDTVKTEGNEIITTVTTDSELIGKEEKNGRQCLRVSYKNVYEIAGKVRQMGMEMFMEGEGEGTGTYWFDPAQGLYVADESVISQDITLAITGQTQMTIPSSQVINVKTKLIEQP